MSEADVSHRQRFLRPALYWTAWVLICVAAVLAVVLLTLTFSGRARMAAVRTTLDLLGAAPPRDENGITNILLLGTGDEHHDGSDLTDTMIIASIDPLRTRSVVLLSLPRDLLLEDTAGIGEGGRINAIYANEKRRLQYFHQMSEEDASFIALRGLGEEIGRKVGLPVHGVVKGDFTAFVTIVDTIGGVDIDVQQRIMDYTYPIADNQVGLFQLEKGMQHLDGETALKFARSRHSSSDFDRSARQQILLKAITERVRSMGRLEQLEIASALLNDVSEHIEMTLDREELLGLAQIAAGLSLDRVITMQINAASGGDYSEARAGGFVYPAPPEMFSGASVLLPFPLPNRASDWSQIQTFAAFLAYERETYLSRSEIALTNAGILSLSAHRFRNELLRYGFSTLPTVRAVEDEGTTTSGSLIWYRDDEHKPTAQFLGELLSFPVAHMNSAQTGSGDVLILLGQNFRFRPFQTLSGAVLP